MSPIRFGLGSIEYAVDHLHSTVLVCARTPEVWRCGRRVFGDKMPSRNLEAIVDKISPAVTKPKPTPSPMTCSKRR